MKDRISVKAAFTWTAICHECDSLSRQFLPEGVEMAFLDPLVPSTVLAQADTLKKKKKKKATLNEDQGIHT